MAMTTKSAKAREIFKYLQRELGIPESATWFELRMARDEVVTVKCEFYPVDNSQIGNSDTAESRQESPK